MELIQMVNGIVLSNFDYKIYLIKIIFIASYFEWIIHSVAPITLIFRINLEHYSLLYIHTFRLLYYSKHTVSSS